MTPGPQSGKNLPLKSLMDYSLCSKYGSKKQYTDTQPHHSFVLASTTLPRESSHLILMCSVMVRKKKKKKKKKLAGYQS
jgi:hypothetical protein